MKSYAFPAALLLSSSVVLADQATTLSPVIVTATRTAETADETLASVSVITRADIERKQAQSVAEVLQGVPGLTLARSGGPGAQTSVSLRGTNSSHVLVLIDGIKVGSATAGLTAFQDLPVDQIERIEVVRGPRSSLYGSEAIGGVIHLFTRKGAGEFRPRASVTLGSHNTRRGDVGFSGSNDSGWINAGFSGLNSDGIDACRPEAATAFGGCFSDEPDRDGYRNRAVTLRAGRRIGDASELEFHGLRSEGELEFDAFEFGEVLDNASETVQQVLGASLRTEVTDRWDSTLQLGRSWDKADSFVDWNFDNRFDTRRDSLSWQNDIAIATADLLTLGLDYQQDQVTSTEVFKETERDNLGAFVQYQTRLGDHDLLASLREDDNEQFGRNTTGNLGWGFPLTDALRITANYGTAFKAPTFNDLYYPDFIVPGYSFFSNPDLSPEKSKTLELGLAGAVKKGNWSLNIYQTDIDDLIAVSTNTVLNVNSARIRGAEAVLTQAIGGWQMNASLTLLDPENRDTGKQLRRRAREILQLDLDRTFGLYSLGATLYAEGKRFEDEKNTRKLDAYSTLDLRAGYDVAPDWALGARVANLLDEDYETAEFFNQEGRTFFVTLSYQP